MNFTKTLVAAALLATGGLAQAVTFSSSVTGAGDAVLTVFDATNNSFYAQDLGVTYSTLVGDLTAATAFVPATLVGDTIANANFSSFITTAGADTLQYRIEAVKTNNYVTTLETDVTTSAFDAQVAGNNIVPGAVSNVINEIKSFGGTAASATNIAVFNSGTGYNYASNTADGGALGSYTNSANLGTALNLYLDTKTAGATDLAVVNFTVSGTTGTLALTTPSSVPLPTTAWMFLSGMVGLLAVKKRKNSAV